MLNTSLHRKNTSVNINSVIFSGWTPFRIYLSYSCHTLHDAMDVLQKITIGFRFLLFISVGGAIRIVHSLWSTYKLKDGNYSSPSAQSLANLTMNSIYWGQTSSFTQNRLPWECTTVQNSKWYSRFFFVHIYCVSSCSLYKHTDISICIYVICEVNTHKQTGQCRNIQCIYLYKRNEKYVL